MKTNAIIFVILLAICALLGVKTFAFDASAKATLVVELLPEDYDGESVPITKELQQQTIAVLQKRLGDKAQVTVKDPNHLIIQVSDNKELEIAEKVIEKQGKLEFREVHYNTETGEIEWMTRMNGTSLKRVLATLDDRSPSGSWMINFELTDEGKAEFGELTKELIGKQLGIFFDGKEISAPTIQSAITGGQGQITGSFTQEEARELANYMNSGALPVKLKIIQSNPLAD